MAVNKISTWADRKHLKFSDNKIVIEMVKKTDIKPSIELHNYIFETLGKQEKYLNCKSISSTEYF